MQTANQEQQVYEQQMQIANKQQSILFSCVSLENTVS
jgi:hypothetical protein